MSYPLFSFILQKKKKKKGQAIFINFLTFSVNLHLFDTFNIYNINFFFEK